MKEGIFLYNTFKNEVLSHLNGLDSDQLKMVRDAMDVVSVNYKIERGETALATADDYAMTLVKYWLVAKKIEGLSDGTIYNYGNTLRLFFEQVRKPLDKIEGNDIRAFLYFYQKERGISDRSLDKVREYIHHFFAWATTEKYLNCNPAATVRPIRYAAEPRRALTPLQMERVRQGCKTPRDSAIIELLFSTACRVSELSTLKLGDVDMETGVVRLFGKGKKYRDSYLSPRAILTLKAYLETRNDNCEYVIKSERGNKGVGKEGLERVVARIVENAGIDKKITPHIIRHTTATIMMQSGDVTQVQKMLGHASVATTMIYAEVNSEAVKASHHKFVV